MPEGWDLGGSKTVQGWDLGAGKKVPGWDLGGTTTTKQSKPKDIIQSIGGAVKGAAFEPLKGINAVLGAPERMVEGTLGSQGNALQRLGHGAYETFHPNDTKTQQANLGRVEAGMGIKPKPGLEKFGTDVAAQTILDPLSYVPFIGEGRMIERGAVGLGEKLMQALPAPVARNAETVSKFFRANPHLDAALTAKGRATYEGIHTSELGKMANQARHDAVLLERSAKDLEAGITPEALTQRSLSGIFEHGSPEMRQQAVELGYKPTAEQAAKPPTGMLPKFDLLTDELYEPMFRLKPKMGEPAPFSKIGRIGKDVPTPYAIPRTGEQPQEELAPLAERWRARLALERARVFEQSVDKRMEEELVKKTLDQNKMIAKSEYVKSPELAKSYLLGRAQASEGVAKVKWLSALSDAYRAALFINPLPHMFNIARLVYLAGGPQTVLRGLKYFAGGMPEKTAQEVEHFVGRPEYLGGIRSGEKFANIFPGARQLREFGQEKLTGFDAAMRGAYLDELKKVNKAPADYELGAEVRKGVGSYESPEFIKYLRAVGAPFPQWRLGVVPQAVGRATLKAPHRVERYARTLTTADQDLSPKVEFSGPVEDFGKLAAAPYGTARYLTSPSTIGGIPAGIIGLAAPGSSVPSALKVGEELGRQYIPGGSILEELLGASPYKESKQKLLNVLLSLVGGYTKP